MRPRLGVGLPRTSANPDGHRKLLADASIVHVKLSQLQLRRPRQWLRFFRLSKRRRSIARERAWLMIQLSTVPFAAS